MARANALKLKKKNQKQNKTNRMKCWMLVIRKRQQATITTNNKSFDQNLPPDINRLKCLGKVFNMWKVFNSTFYAMRERIQLLCYYYPD